MSIRRPAVAGMFYPGSAGELRALVEYCFTGPGGPGSLPSVRRDGTRGIAGLVCPHAGLIYSGAVAACGYYRLAEDGLPDVAVLIGPSHRAYFPALALSDDEQWSTPLGNVAVDEEISSRIVDALPEAEFRASVHSNEHCLEVQIPFLQYLTQAADARIGIVPILVGGAAQSVAPEDAVEFARRTGEAIANALSGKSAVIIASTDFTHYESGEEARRKDSQALQRILALDEEGLLDTVASQDISMCGSLPTAITITACKRLGAESTNQLAYRNSGDVTGDQSEVVGYAAVEIYR